MKKIIISIVAIVTLISTGCDDCSTRYIEVDRSPAIPQGVYSVTGDEAIYIHWLPVRDNDLDYYRVWWCDEADGRYELMGTSTNESYIDTDVDNGETYYYAVSSVDARGNESELSYETVFDTPRPEGYNQNLYDFQLHPDLAGFDFSSADVVPYNNSLADIFIEYDTDLEAFFINVRDDTTDIQDMGYTDDFDEIGYSPSDGWSFVGWCEIIVGHTYIVWTRDDHFAKLRVIYADDDNLDNIIFDWAYQTASENPGRMELARPPHDENFLRNEGRGKEMQIIRGN